MSCRPDITIILQCGEKGKMGVGGVGGGGGASGQKSSMYGAWVDPGDTSWRMYKCTSRAASTYRRGTPDLAAASGALSPKFE